MALTYQDWAQQLVLDISHFAAASRGIAGLMQLKESDAHFSTFYADVSHSKDTRDTMKHLKSAVESMADDLDDAKLRDLGIDPLTLPNPYSFLPAEPEPKQARIVQIELQEKITSTDNKILYSSKPNRSPVLKVIKTDGTATQVGADIFPIEISKGLYLFDMNWNLMSQLNGLTAGYYLIQVNDGEISDGKIIEIYDPATEGKLTITDSQSIRAIVASEVSKINTTGITVNSGSTGGFV